MSPSPRRLLSQTGLAAAGIAAAAALSLPSYLQRPRAKRRETLPAHSHTVVHLAD